MKILISMLYLIPCITLAGIPKDITPEEAKTMGVEVVLWPNTKQSEINETQGYFLCTPVTIFFPLVDQEHPNFINANASGTITLGGRLLAFPRVSVQKTDDGKRNFLTSCVPLGSKYKVAITFSYSPVEEPYPMCPPSFRLDDLNNFVSEEHLK